MQINSEKPVDFAPDYNILAQPKEKLSKRRFSDYDKRITYVLYFFTALIILGGILWILFNVCNILKA